MTGNDSGADVNSSISTADNFKTPFPLKDCFRAFTGFSSGMLWSSWVGRLLEIGCGEEMEPTSSSCKGVLTIGIGSRELA